MLKPGSSKLKESEVKLLEEIKEFERQEDKTLQNMEETLLMMSSLAPTASPPSTEANFQDVTLKQIIQEDNQHHFIDDSDAAVDSELFDIDHLEQQILEQGDKKDIQPPYVYVRETSPKTVATTYQPARVPCPA